MTDELRVRAENWLGVCREDYVQNDDSEFVKVLDMLLALLKREEVEAVAWLIDGEFAVTTPALRDHYLHYGREVVPLYTSPPPSDDENL